MANVVGLTGMIDLGKFLAGIQGAYDKKAWERNAVAKGSPVIKQGAVALERGYLIAV